MTKTHYTIEFQPKGGFYSDEQYIKIDDEDAKVYLDSTTGIGPHAQDTLDKIRQTDPSITQIRRLIVILVVQNQTRKECKELSWGTKQKIEAALNSIYNNTQNPS